MRPPEVADPPWACARLPAWLLQRADRLHGGRGAAPLVVVEHDRPNARIVDLDRCALAAGLHVGMRWSEALGLCPDLQASLIPPAGERAALMREVESRLRAFSPRLEADPDLPGLWWLDARGLRGLHGTPERWAERLRRAVADGGWRVRLVLGWSRAGSWAATFVGPPLRIFASPAEESAALAATPLLRLPLPPEAAETFARLGLRTVGDLTARSPDAMGDRFGPAWARWARLLRDGDPRPLHGPPPAGAPMVERVFEPPETNRERLLFAGLADLGTLLDRLRNRGEQPTGLRLDLRLEGRREQTLELRPAAPTGERRIWADLLRLRLDRLTLPHGVEGWRLTGPPERARGEQLMTAATRPKRDPAELRRALDRLRAAFGDAAVCTLTAGDGHLPATRQRPQPLRDLPSPRPAPPAASPPRVRRLYRAPREATPPSAAERTTARGPWRLSGGWWRREVVRDLWWIERPDGRRLWLAHDPRRSRWTALGELA